MANENDMKLIKAANEGNTDQVKALIEEGYNVNAEDRSGNTLVRRAPDLLKFLMKKKDFQRVNENDMELIKAAGEGNIEQVKALIEEGYNVNAEDKSGNTLVHWAAYTDNVDLLKFLKEKGADLKAVNHFGEQAMHMAAKGNKVQAAAYLKEQGVDVNAKDNIHSCPIHEAARKDHIEMIQWLCENGAKVNIRSYGDEPIHFVARNGNIAAMDALVKHGADVNISSDVRYNYPPAYYAVEEGHLDMLKWLKNNGADMKAVIGIEQGSLLHTVVSAEKEDLKIIDFLVNECGVSINRGNEYGTTPLMRAADKGNYDMAKKLIELGADVRTGNPSGMSALSFAAANGHDKIVELLIKNGCNPNVGDKNGYTPAHYAAGYGHESTLKLLWKHGADLDQRTNWELGFLPGFSAENLYESTFHKKLPIGEWKKELREEKIKENKAAKQDPQITANTPSNGNAINVLKGSGQNISIAADIEVTQSGTSRSV